MKRTKMNAKQKTSFLTLETLSGFEPEKPHPAHGSYSVGLVVMGGYIADSPSRRSV